MKQEASGRTAPAAPARPTVNLGPLPGLIGYSLRRAQLAVYHDFHATVTGYDIRPVQLGVLLVLAANPGMKQSDVGAALGIKRSNFVALIDGLERRGLVRRERAAGDRRSYAIHLTGAGEAMIGDLRILLDRHEQRIVGQIGETGRAQLLDLLGKLQGLAEGLDDHDIDDD